MPVVMSALKALRLLSLAAIVIVAATAADAPAAKTATSEGLDFFEKKIRPVLVDNCYKCHSATSEKLKGELRLDSLAGMLKGGTSKSPSVIPGNPDKSLLITAIRHTDDDLKMPKKKLDDAIIADLVAWVKMGAPYPGTDAATAAATAGPAAAPYDFAKAKDFWSFRPLQGSPAPAVHDAAWAATTIDRFILAKLEAKQFAPAPPADRRTLIRRATFDLTGLPPAPEEIDAFLADQSPQAFAILVDRLLASPAYGERWGRHWLDLVHYADTAGESADYPVPQAYRYRNYVIDAFNHDKPYDQFLREQIAGDLLPAKDEAQAHEQLIATGFIAGTRRFSVAPEGQMHLTIEDTIDTLGKTVLGLAVGCARCHDHKFDPIPSSDYYALYGFFSSTRYPFPGSENNRRQRDLVPLIPPAEVDRILGPKQAELAKAEADLKQLETEFKDYKKATREGKPANEMKPTNDAKVDKDGKLIAPAEEPKTTAKPRFNKEDDWKKAVEVAKKKRDTLNDELPPIPKAYAVAEGTPKNAHIQKRGEPGQQGDEVPRGFLKILGGQTLPADCKDSGRLQLAQWLSDAKNPLTARVMVNRIWQYHFGSGIVPTPSDFGARGRPPTHPELLDYLASRFIAGGWSIKAMHRELMLTSTYQQADVGDAKGAVSDANNELRGHFNRRRLDAEEIRDAMLAIAGTLDRTMPEGHPFPPESKWGFTQHAAFSAVYESNHRSVYLMEQRIRKHPFFEVFDGADPNSSTAERLVSTTPIQALFMMNDPFVFAQAEAFAKRVAGERPDDRQRIERAYVYAFGRAADGDEVAAAVKYLAAYHGKLQALPTKPADATAKPDSKTTTPTELGSYLRILFSSNEFLFVD